MRLLFGLGNPGAQYQLSRHNIGFLVLDELAERTEVKLNRRKHQSFFARTKLAGQEILLIQPQTYMNLSGACVFGWLQDLGLGHQDIIIVCDDLDGDFGRLRLRKSGGDGGHRGLRSLIETLGTKKFIRLKVGIGRPPQGVDPRDYVLSPFLDEESEALARLIAQAADCLEALLIHGVAYAMNHFHRKAEQK